MRLLRIVCVVAVMGFAALALGMALKDPASRSHAQNQVQIQVNPSVSAHSTSSSAVAAAVPVSSTGAAAVVIASNVGIRTLAVASQSSETAFANSAASSPAQLYVTAIDRPDQVFSYVVRAASSITPATAAKFLAAPAAGVGTVGSIGDGGAASAAELDLSLNDFSMRSEVAIAPDGTLFIADTGNATIRTVGGAASTEPSVIRSVAGRWAPRQNVELTEPYGVTLDRAGNLYIADHGANAVIELFGAASAKAGQLEVLAHMVSPAAVAVTPDGNTVFAASPDTGVIVAINTQTHALRNAVASPAPLFAAVLARSNSARIVPQGLAVDGGGNLFIAYTATGGTSDQILRLDAFSSKLTVAARGLSAPGNISFDSQGNLFVANQGMRQVLEFHAMGVPATGVTLTAAAKLPRRRHGLLRSADRWDQPYGTVRAQQQHQRRDYRNQRGLHCRQFQRLYDFQFFLRYVTCGEQQLRVQRGLHSGSCRHQRVPRRTGAALTMRYLLGELRWRHGSAHNGSQRRCR